LTRLEYSLMIGMAGDTPPRTPRILLLRSSNRPFELFCGVINAECNRIQAVATALKRLFLHEADDTRLVAFM
jgi:hypothetical protein